MVETRLCLTLRTTVVREAADGALVDGRTNGADGGIDPGYRVKTPRERIGGRAPLPRSSSRLSRGFQSRPSHVPALAASTAQRYSWPSEGGEGRGVGTEPLVLRAGAPRSSTPDLERLGCALVDQHGDALAHDLGFLSAACDAARVGHRTPSCPYGRSVDKRTRLGSRTHRTMTPGHVVVPSSRQRVGARGPRRRPQLAPSAPSGRALPVIPARARWRRMTSCTPVAATSPSSRLA